MKFITKYVNWIVAVIFIFNAARSFLVGENWMVSLIFLILAVIVALRGTSKAKS